MIGQDIMFRNAKLQRYDFSLSGGSENSNTYFALGLLIRTVLLLDQVLIVTTYV